MGCGKSWVDFLLSSFVWRLFPVLLHVMLNVQLVQLQEKYFLELLMFNFVVSIM